MEWVPFPPRPTPEPQAKRLGLEPITFHVLGSHMMMLQKKRGPELVAGRCSPEKAGKVLAPLNIQDQQEAPYPARSTKPSWVLHLSGARSRELTPSFALKPVSPVLLTGFPGSLEFLLIFIHFLP